METSTKGLKDQIKALRQIGAREDRIAKIAPRIWRLAEDDFKKRFASSPATTSSGTVYGGVQWARLSEAYLDRRPDRRSGQQLIDTGELAKSFRRGQPGNVATVDGNKFTFGSELPKAVYLDEKRPIAVMHPALVQGAEEIFEKYLITGR